MKSLFKNLFLPLATAAALLPVQLAFAAAPPPPPPTAVDTSKLTPEQKAAFDKLTPAQKAALTKPTAVPAAPATNVNARATNVTPTGTSSPTVPSGSSNSMYIVVAIGVLVVIALGSLVIRRRNTQI